MAEKDEIRYLGDMQKLTLLPTDICVLTMDGYVPEADVHRIKEMWRDIMGDARLIVLSSGSKLGVLSTAPSELISDPAA